MTPIRYHEAAEEELLTEIGHLEMRRVGLGRRFHSEFRRAEDRVSEYPASGVEVRPGIRRINLRKFHYGMIYAVE